MKRIKEITIDFYIYLGFIILGLFIIWQSSDLRSASALFPRLLSYLILLLSVTLLFLNFIHKKNLLTEEKSESPKKTEIKPKKDPLYFELIPLVIIFFCILFLLLFQNIGFDISAFITIFAIMVFMNKKEGLQKYYLAILIPLVIILLFKYGLNLRLPLFIEKFF